MRVPFNVQDFKEKRAAQLDRARKIREERDMRKGPTQQQDDQPRSSAPSYAQAAPAIEVPLRSSSFPTSQPQRQVMPATRRQLIDAAGPLMSSDSASSINSYGHDSTGANGAVVPVRGDVFGGTSHVPIGENELSSAVVAGIINLEQAEKLWRHLSNEPPGKPVGVSSSRQATAQGTSRNDGYADARSRQEPTAEPRSFANTAPPSPPIRGMAASANPQPQPSRFDISDDRSAVAPERPPRGAKPSKTSGWNFDTEVAYNDENLSPEPAPASNRRSLGGGKTAAARRPEWNGAVTEGAFDDIPVGGTSKPRSTSSSAAGPAPLANTMGGPVPDKLALLKGRQGARSGAPGAQQFTVETSPFGAPPARPAPQAASGGGGLRCLAVPRNAVPKSAYTRPEPEYVAEDLDDRPLKGSSPPAAPPMYDAPSGPMSQCPVCERSFNSDRIAKHIGACEKAHKARKPFNAAERRQEEEAIKAAKEAKRAAKRNPDGKAKGAGAAAAAAAAKAPGALPKWKQQHLEFQNALKAGRGAPGDYIPVPVQDTRVECPHCGRRFAEDVADRHIPKCANIVSNKPRAAVPRR